MALEVAVEAERSVLDGIARPSKNKKIEDRAHFPDVLAQL